MTNWGKTSRKEKQMNSPDCLMLRKLGYAPVGRESQLAQVRLQLDE